MDDLYFGPFETTTEAATSGNELMQDERANAIRIFSKAYFGKFPVDYFEKNTNKKHDFIIAHIGGEDASKVLPFMKNLVSNLNKKQKEFTFVYRTKGSYVFANPRVINAKTEALDPEPPKHYENAMEFFGVSDPTGEFMLEDFKPLPIIKEYMNQGYNLKDSVAFMESQVYCNPLLTMELIPESAFPDADEYDDYLFECFYSALEYCNFDSDLLAQLAVESPTFEANISSVVVEDMHENVRATKNKLTATKFKVNKAKDGVKGVLSPIVDSLKNQVDELIGEKAETKEVITNSTLMRLRRIFLKLIVVWKSAALTTAFAMVVGGWVGIVIRIILFIARASFYTKTAVNLVSDDGKDRGHEDAKKRCIQELELELRITREKLDDAKSAGDLKAKYQLMRVENTIEKEIFRIKYGKDPSQFYNGNGKGITQRDS